MELLSIELGVELIMNLYEELEGQNCLIPVNFNEFYLYSDSAVALSWIQSYLCKFDKLNKRSIIVQNRLTKLASLCEKHSVKIFFH